MATTNHTPTIELSQYISTDKTSYLVNYNDDMLKIDTAIATDRDNINTAQNTADTAEGKADTNKLSIDAINAELNDPSTGLSVRVAANTGSINTINSLIGNGEPTTTDKTLIGAINEINGDVGEVDTYLGDVFSLDEDTSVEVAGTFATVADELAAFKTTLDTMIANLNDDEFIEVKAFNIGGWGYLKPADVWQLKNNTTVTSRNASWIFANASTMRFLAGNINFANPSASFLNRVEIAMADGTVSPTILSPSASGATGNRIYYAKYITKSTS